MCGWYYSSLCDMKLYGLYIICPGVDDDQVDTKGRGGSVQPTARTAQRAQRGQQTIITRHGRPIAILTPISKRAESSLQRSLLPLAGSGRGLYGHDSKSAVRLLRDEWNRWPRRATAEPTDFGRFRADYLCP